MLSIPNIQDAVISDDMVMEKKEGAMIAPKSEQENNEEEEEKDDEALHERFSSETFEVTKDIDIERIADPQFKEICQIDDIE